MLALLLPLWFIALAFIVFQLYRRGEARDKARRIDAPCTCPSGNGSLSWPCGRHPPKGRKP